LVCFGCCFCGCFFFFCFVGGGVAFFFFFSGLYEELANCVSEGIAVPTFPAHQFNL